MTLKTNFLIRNTNRHGFHLVDPSPWPILTAFSVFIIVFNLVLWMHGYSTSIFIFFSLISFKFLLWFWWRDVVREATFEGNHTSIVQRGLKLGMILFIVSEIMFFFAFFIAFFYSSFNSSVGIGCTWPPVYISTIEAIQIPLLNSFLLLFSGFTVTLAHNYLIEGNWSKTFYYLGFTIVLATIFTLFQIYEYNTCPFNISDSVYASCFFMLTGLHGFHVVLGTTFLAICLWRHFLHHFTQTNHLGFEAASWYWHFVDVVWLFLFVTIYWWGGA